MKSVATPVLLARITAPGSLCGPRVCAAWLGAVACSVGLGCAPSEDAHRKFDIATSHADTDDNRDAQPVTQGNDRDAGPTTGDTKTEGTKDVSATEGDVSTSPTDDTNDDSNDTGNDVSDDDSNDTSNDASDDDSNDATTTSGITGGPTSGDTVPESDGSSGDSSDDTSNDTTNSGLGEATNDTVEAVSDSSDTSVDSSDDTSTDTSDDTSTDTSDDTTDDTTDDLPHIPSDMAELEWVIGGEGTGPGLFDDARFLAVDGDGNAYVAEYMGDALPRIQVFDTEGTFVRQWYLERQGFIGGMAATLDGQLYVLQGGYVDRYTAIDGTGMETIPVGSSFSSDVLAVAPDGGFVLVSSERIQRFSSDGSAGDSYDSISHVATELDFFYLSGAAVDGSGSVLVVDSSEPSVFRFDEYGKTSWGRIGVEGDGPGFLETGIEAVTTDRYGRIYAADWDGIEVFEPGGGFTGFIELTGAIFAMATSIDDELFVLERNAELLYKLKLEE